MRNPRNLSDEEIALLSEEVPDDLSGEVEPARPGGAFAALWAAEENLQEESQRHERPTPGWESFQKTADIGSSPEIGEERRGGAFEAMWSVQENLELSDDPIWRVDQSGVGDLGWFEPIARTIYNIPIGAAQGVGEIPALMRPADFAAIGEQFVQTGDLDPRVGMSDTQREFVDLAADVGTFAKGTLANPYDPRNASLFDPSTTQERMPTLHALGALAEGVLPASPWDPEYNPEWAENLSTLVQESSGEIAFEIGLGAAFGGGGIVSSGIRRATGSVSRGVRQGISAFRMEGDLDAADLLLGRDYARRQKGATVELDLARREGFTGGAMGGVIQDPETGRHFVSTAAHFVVGNQGQAIDFQGIRARTGSGEIGTVKQISAIDFERDIALLEVSGLTETLDLPDTPLGGPQSLLGRSGITSDARIAGESGASIEVTPGVIGVAGESGAPLISGRGDISGVYVGEIGDVEPRGLYTSGVAVSELLSTVGGTGVRLGSEASQRALREGLHYRYGRDERGVTWEGRASRAEDVAVSRESIGVSAQNVVVPFMLPQLASGSDDVVRLHSLDPEAELEFHDPRYKKRYESGRVESSKLPGMLDTDSLAKLYSGVSYKQGLFFRIGERGEDVSSLQMLDIEQTLRYSEWYESEFEIIGDDVVSQRPPWENFAFVGGGEYKPDVSVEKVDGGSLRAVESQGVVGFEDITALGRHLRHLEMGESGIGKNQVLQIIRGHVPEYQQRGVSGYGEGKRFAYEPEVLKELELPTVEALRDIYKDIESFGGAVKQEPYIDRTPIQIFYPDRKNAPFFDYHVPTTPAQEVRVEARAGAVGETEYVRVPVEPPVRSESVKLDVENWTSEELRKEIYYGDSKRAGKARDELESRRLSIVTGARRESLLYEIEREKALHAETVEAREAREAGIESDLDKAGHFLPESNPTDSSFMAGFPENVAQDYQGDIGEDPDVTGKVYEGWQDPEDSFGRTDQAEIIEKTDVDVDIGDQKEFTKIEGGMEVSFQRWIEEYGVEDPVIGTEGTLEGGLLGSEKVSSVDRYQSTESGLRPETQAQLADVFGGVIERGEELEALRAGSGRMRKSIVERATEEDPLWKEKMLADHLKRKDAARVRVENPDVPSFDVFREAVIRLLPDPDAWRADLRKLEKQEIWMTREVVDETGILGVSEKVPDFEAVARHMGPIKRQAAELKDAWMAANIDERLPWQRERDAANVSDFEIWRQWREERRESGPREPGIIATPPRQGQDVDDLLPLEIRKEMADKLEQPGWTLERFEQQVLREEAGIDVPEEPVPVDKGSYLRSSIAPDIYTELARNRAEQDIGLYLTSELLNDARTAGFHITAEERGAFRLSLERAEELRAAGVRVQESVLRKTEEVREGFVRSPYALEDEDWGLGWHETNVREYQERSVRLRNVEIERVSEREQRRVETIESQQPPDELLVDFEAETAAEYTAASSWTQSLSSMFDETEFMSDVVVDLGEQMSVYTPEVNAAKLREAQRTRKKIRPREMSVEEAAQLDEVTLRKWMKGNNLNAEELAELRREVQQEQAAGRASERLKQEHEAFSMEWKQNRTVKTHSDEDIPYLLDFDSPRAQLRSFSGIESGRTYGLELELITDLTREEMEGELEWAMGQGVQIKYDTSLKTAHSDIAIEHHPPANRRINQLDSPGAPLRIEAADYYDMVESLDLANDNTTYISGDSYDTRYAHELVFPVMRGGSGIDLIESTVRRLQDFEVELNTSMGMHVHVGAEDLSNYDLVGVWGAFAAREDVIDLMHERSRREVGSSYAKSLSSNVQVSMEDVPFDSPEDVPFGFDFSSTVKKGFGAIFSDAYRRSLLSTENRSTFLDKVGYGNRYQKLNLRGFKHKTIEYRQPAPTLDIYEIEQHVGFITDFVDEFAGSSPIWAFREDPRLREEFAGYDFSFETPDDIGLLPLGDSIVKTHSAPTEWNVSDWKYDYDEKSRSGRGMVGSTLIDNDFADPFDESFIHEEIPPDFFGEPEGFDEPLDSVSSEVEKVELTASQQRALRHTTGGAVVMAGPGSGKSSTLLERLRYLSDEGHATSDDVLTLVFGKKAQLDLKERASEIGGDWEISTIDAFARSVVRENFGELGYKRAPDISKETFRDWLSKPGRLDDFDVSDFAEDTPEVWSDLYEETRRSFSEGREDYSGLPEQVQEAIHSYRVERFESAKMDFADATSQAGYLLESNEAVRQRYQNRYKFLQVDEFQDVSLAQARFVRHLSHNPWVVGDLDQGIMSFRGGTGDPMRQMIESGASLYNIEENFRSTPEIVGAAQGFIASNLGRIDVTQQAVSPSGSPVSMVGVDPLVSEQSAIARVAEQVREGEETAILTRTRRERDVLERELPVELQEQGWESSEIENLLTFETMHASKGREWQNVILPINLLESDFGERQSLFTLPTPYAKTALDFAEEERLFYVGMTRAEENLTIMGDPSHPYFSQVSRAIEGKDEISTPAYLEPDAVREQIGEQPARQQRRGLFGGLVGRVGEALDKLIHGDTPQGTGQRQQARTQAERRRGRNVRTHSADIDRNDDIFVQNVVGGSASSERKSIIEQAYPYLDVDQLTEEQASIFFEKGNLFPKGSAGGAGDLSLLLEGDPIRGQGLSFRERLSRGIDEARDERAWGGFTSSIAKMSQDTALINVAASLTVEGVRMAAGHDLNVGSLVHAGASSMVSVGATALDARFGSRGILPESRYDLSELAGEVSDVPEGAGQHLKRIFEEAGAGTSRWGRGSLSRELERYGTDDLELMFGESGTSYLTEFAYQSRRFGQRSYQTQRDLPETLLGIFSGDIPRARRYTYDPEVGEVNVSTSRRWTLDRLLEGGVEHAPEDFALPMRAWLARRSELRENPDQDILHRWSRGIIPPLQGEDVKPNVNYMMLPEARGIGRFFGRYYSEPENAKAWNLEDITRAIGAEGWASRIADRKDFRRERASVLDSRRRSPELYQWQDPEHLFSEISGTFGVSDSDVSFGSPRLGSPYSRFARHLSRLPRSARYPLGGAAATVGGKLLYDYFAGDEEDEQLVLDDPAGYSLSPRYAGLGAIMRSMPFRRLRARTEQVFDDLYGEDTLNAEMMKSMIVGKKGNLPRDVKETFVSTGQIHALTFSGMHVSMFSNIVGRYPAVAAPAALSVARDMISPPDEKVVEPSQSYFDKFTPSDDPWTPRWNPELPTSGQIRALKSKGMLPDEYELEIPEPPSWAWWDPAENYRKDEERRGQRLATENQVKMLGSLGLLPEDYEVGQHKREEIRLTRGEPGIQDVLPWTVYGMFGVLPEMGISYIRGERDELEDIDDESGFDILPDNIEVPILKSLRSNVSPQIGRNVDLPRVRKIEKENVIESLVVPGVDDEQVGSDLIDPVAPLLSGMRNIERGGLSDVVVEPRVTKPEMIVLSDTGPEINLQQDEISNTSSAMAYSMSSIIDPVAPFLPGMRNIERGGLSDIVVEPRVTKPGIAMLSDIVPEINLQQDEISNTSSAMVYSTQEIEDTSVGRFRELESRNSSGGSSSDIINLASEFIGFSETEDTQALTDLFESQGIRYYCDIIDPSKTPWCAAFAGSILKKGGYEHLDTLTAREYRNYGEEGTGVIGDIAVWQNHIGFVAQVGENEMILGGNQDDIVKLKSKEEIDSKSRFLGYRKPVRKDGKIVNSGDDYTIDGLEFDVHESPHPGFNPWLDPTPEGFTGLPDDNAGASYRGIPIGRIQSELFDFASSAYQSPGDSERDLIELYKKLGIDIDDGISRDEASRLIEYEKSEREKQKELATENQITALGKMYPEMNLEGLSRDLATQLFDAYEGYRERGPKMATESQITSLTRMYPDKDLTNLTMEDASELFDTYKPPEKMASESQIRALTRMYPDKDLSGLTMSQASELFDTYKRPVRSNEATEAQLSYLEQLRGGGSANVLPIEDVDESDGLTRQEVSTLIDYEKAKQRSSVVNREAAGPRMATASQLQYLEQLDPQRYGGISGVSEDVMGIEDVSFDDGITSAEARTLFDYEDAQRKSREAAGPAMASESQLSALQRMFPGQFGRQSEESSVIGIEDITFDDGITREEAGALFDYQSAVVKSQGPPMASEAQVSALQRYFPQMFGEIEEPPLVPLEQINFTDGVTREEASQAFRHVTQIPPPMASPRQVARLEMEFPHAFKRLGRAEQYLGSGQSYGVVQSLEDIYDADTFTGMLFDAETGQTFKEDTVRLGDFNAPEIKPDQMKPQEYQEREAARAREARDVFRSMVERFNVGRDVEQEGYVVPIDFRHDSRNLGGLERGFYGRVLGDVNFEGVDYEQFMIQQGMGSVYGADIEWGAEQIDPLALWQRSPTYSQRLSKGAEGLLGQIPGTILGGMLEGMDPVDAVVGTFKQVPGALKNIAIDSAKKTVTQAATDFLKERFTDDFTPNNLSFAERYIGNFAGIGEKAGGIGEKAGSFFQSGWGAAVAPIALAAGTALIGERSLDQNYADVIPSEGQREKAWNEYLLDRRENQGGLAPQSSEAAGLRLIKRALREVLTETGLGSIDDLSVGVSRKLRESDARGITRR